MRLRRIERAKREFDQALISTIHGFCQRVLTQNAFETGAAFGVELDSAIDGLLDDIISDFYSAYVNQLSDDKIETYEFWHDQKADDLKKLAKKAVGDFSLQLLPESGMRTEHTAPDRTNFLSYVRREYDRRYKARSIVAFDDLTRHFAERLSTPQGVDAMVDTVGRRFKVILVDEFQDTDAHQWTIFSSLFGQNADGKRPYLFLIGDPKQAIYGFRGADIRVYGVAKSAADRVYTLTLIFAPMQPSSMH